MNTPLTENFAFYGPGGQELYFVRDFAGVYHLPLSRALGPTMSPAALTGVRSTLALPRHRAAVGST